MKYGTIIFRYRVIIVAAWAILAATMLLTVPKADPEANEPMSFLPPQSPYNQAITAMRQSFPDNTSLSDVVLVFERTGEGLTKTDLSTIEFFSDQIRHADSMVSDKSLSGIRIRSPRTVPLLISERTPQGQAALVIVSTPYNFVTIHSSRMVEHIYKIAAHTPLPAGLTVAVTGSSGVGRDYALAAERSHGKTMIVTLLSVMVILLIVYRSPAAALIPLGAIGIAGVVTAKLLVVLQPLGLHAGTAEQIFVFVLLFGAGTDYSLLFISRYREHLDIGEAPDRAAATGLSSTLGAILASAATNTIGLLTLLSCDYSIFRTTGPAVAVALAVALLAAITLTPALVGIVGSRMFWPIRVKPVLVPADNSAIAGRKIWHRVAGVITRRPLMVIIVTMLLLVFPAVKGARLTWMYNTLASLQSNFEKNVGNAAAGVDMIKRHWPIGEMTPITMMVRLDKPMSPLQCAELADKLTQIAGKCDGVMNVRSFSQPLGKAQQSKLAATLAPVSNPLGFVESVAKALSSVREEYLSPDQRATRLSVILDEHAFSLHAMNTVKLLRQALADELQKENLKADIFLTGATAEMIEIRAVTQHDFHRVVVLALSVIFLIVLILLRDALLSAFMVFSTILSYLATLGLCSWVFVGLLGQEGLDWKVEAFLFVVMVAVGQDYNIFLAARLAQEGHKWGLKEATRRAVIYTGPVISSCGLIMAATLGSLMAGELGLLKQLGFAFALGMLIDTFLVRPLLLPAFAVLTGRTGKSWGLLN